MREGVTMIPVVLRKVMMSSAGFVILLENKDSGRILPIHIGPVEAQAILFAQRGVKKPRPLTHDLMKNLLQALGTRVEKVIIHDFRDPIFFAKLSLLCKSEHVVVDARPSDAIALAIRVGAPILVAPAVMDKAGLSAADLKKSPQMTKKRQRGDPMSGLKKALVKAVGEERYEDAAQLRDEIAKKLERK